MESEKTLYIGIELIPNRKKTQEGINHHLKTIDVQAFILYLLKKIDLLLKQEHETCVKPLDTQNFQLVISDIHHFSLGKRLASRRYKTAAPLGSLAKRKIEA
ncbi:MAG: hypothetical protein JW932_08445 [Deltaproteobacteria bacterium]|nr:hypothetical protein [Deltaproteobacteria bacterium]